MCCFIVAEEEEEVLVCPGDKLDSDESSPDVCRSSSHRSQSRGSSDGVFRPTDGVRAMARQEDAGEARPLVVVPPDDAGQRGVEGDGDRVEDVPGIPVERREGAVTSPVSELTADLIALFVKLSPVGVSGPAEISI